MSYIYVISAQWKANTYSGLFLYSGQWNINRLPQKDLSADNRSHIFNIPNTVPCSSFQGTVFADTFSQAAFLQEIYLTFGRSSWRG